MIREVLLLLSTRHRQRVTVNWLEANRTHNHRLNTNILYINKIRVIMFYIRFILNILYTLP